MVDLAELQTRLENLRALRAGGEREIQFGNERVAYRGDAELAAAIADLERQIASASGVQPIRMVTFSTSKGL